MKVIALTSQKGGSGKSTLTTNLSVAAVRANKRTLIIDLDPQQTAEAWFQDRDADAPGLIVAEAKDLKETLSRAKRAKYEVVIVDTAGRDEPATAAAVRAADFCLVPCRPSPSDMKAIPPTASTIDRLGKPFAFVINQAPARGPRVREARVGLSMLGPVAPTQIVTRAAYQDAQGNGEGVLEYEPNGKAAAEVAALWSWLTRQMKKRHG